MLAGFAGGLVNALVVWSVGLLVGLLVDRLAGWLAD